MRAPGTALIGSLAVVLLQACGGGGGAPAVPAVAFSCIAQTQAVNGASGVAASTLLQSSCNASPDSCLVNSSDATCARDGNRWALTSTTAGTYAITWTFSGNTQVAAGSAPGGTVNVQFQTGNQVPIAVDAGPVGTPPSYNQVYVSVTLCVPGSTTECQTIDHIKLDSASVGLRIFASVLKPSVSLPPPNLAAGQSLWSCAPFAANEMWGSIRLADVYLGSEVSPQTLIQLVNDPAVAVPSSCSSQGIVDTLENSSAKGLLGVRDLGSLAVDQLSICDQSGCSTAECYIAECINNPISLFAHDSNGVTITLPSISPLGAATATGTLTFGIGTQSNNTLGSAVLLAPANDYNQVTNWQGMQYVSMLDTGTSDYDIPNLPVPTCSDLPDASCPSSAQSFMATLSGTNSNSQTVNFTIGNYDQLLEQTPRVTALDDVAYQFNVTYLPVIWGTPFFYGRTVFFLYSNYPGGPFVAF